MRRIVLLLIAFSLAAPVAAAQGGDEPTRRVEVVEVRGIIDGAVEGAIETGLDVAREGEAEAVVLQIDSIGVLGAERARRIADTILGADVPVVTWVGPPGARAENAAAALAIAGHIRSMAPGSAIGPARTLDLRASGEQPEAIASLLRDVAEEREIAREVAFDVYLEAWSADAAEDAGVVDAVAVQLPDLLREIDGTDVTVDSDEVSLSTDPDDLTVRFRKPDLLGRLLHAVAQPSIAYLLLLLGLAGIVFEAFHPDTGPAGVAGLLGLGLGLYGIVVLGGSWVGVGLIVAGIAAFSVDLRFEGLGVFTALGFVSLVAGSLLLFGDPWLRVDPWVLAFGVVGMVLFLLGAMSRVLRDLRAIARGELEVQDPHPHPQDEEDDDHARSDAPLKDEERGGG